MWILAGLVIVVIANEEPYCDLWLAPDLFAAFGFLQFHVCQMNSSDLVWTLLCCS